MRSPIQKASRRASFHSRWRVPQTVYVGVGHLGSTMMHLKRVAAVILAFSAAGTIRAAEAPVTRADEKLEAVSGRCASHSLPVAKELTVNCGNQVVGLESNGAASSAPTTNLAPTFNWGGLAESFFSLLGKVAWPLAAVYIALLFKKEIAVLLARIKRGKWGSAEFEFEDYVREVEAEANIPRTRENERITLSAAAQASNDPRGAIVAAWIEVEEALFALVRNKHLSDVAGSSTPSRSSLSAIRAVQRAQALDANWIALFHDLRVLRNEAAHSTDFSPTTEAVIKYVQLAKELATAMRVAAS